VYFCTTEMKDKENKNPQDLDLFLVGEAGKAPNEQDVQQTQVALLNFAQAHAIEPPLSIKEQIMAKMAKLNDQKANQKSFDLNNLPLLTPDANWLDWKETVKNIPPPEHLEDVHLHTLESNDTRELFLAFVKEIVPEEVHHDLLESFILLDGACECHITSENGATRTVRMRTGDYIAFKIGEVHDIHITSSEPAIAILQWLKIAA
jgi:mannose-6-phosphate isomerase-like protein (cupin superfamily)